MEQRIQLFPGVWLQCVQTQRFKSACLSISLLRPLRREEAAMNALLANVLIQGSQNHPDLQSISQAADRLYGASIGPLVRKNGEIQTWGLYAGFLEDRFAPARDPVLEPVARLLGELLLQPRLENGGFSAGYVEREKNNLINTIESALNDKQAYADRQMLQAMCSQDNFGVPRLGNVEDVQAITPDSLYRHYQAALASSPVEIFYAGSAPAQAVAGLLTEVLADLPQAGLVPLPYRPLGRRDTPQYREQAMPLAQAKLSMGFTTGITATSPDFPALMVFNALFGGDLTSKLFQTVREKLSLCYYASSAVYGAKGILTVSSGILTENYDRVKGEILRQLAACQAGEITPAELSAAQETICSSLRTVTDTVGRMEDYAMFCQLSRFPLSPEAYRQAVTAVTLEDAARVARQVRLDTIFFLKGVGE